MLREFALRWTHRLPFLEVQGHNLVLYLKVNLRFRKVAFLVHSIQLDDDKWLHFTDISLRLLPSKNYCLINMINNQSLSLKEIRVPKLIYKWHTSARDNLLKAIVKVYWIKGVSFWRNFGAALLGEYNRVI